jgi:hypothetical protein
MSGLYDKGREAFLNADIDWTADNIKVVGVDTAAYTVNLSTHQFLSDVPAPARILTSGNLSGKTATGGVADANDVTFPAATGNSIAALVLYKDTGVAGTSSLIAYIDAGPVTPNGSDLTITWDNGASKIFKL